MKKIILNSGNRIVALVLLLLITGRAFAQTTLGDPARDYDKKTLPKDVFLEFFGVAVVIAIIFYAAYRYRRNKGSRKQLPPMTK